MKEETLIHGWVVELPEKCSVMTNKAGEVAIVYLTQQFGDMSPLLLKLEADHVDFLSLPQIISKVQVTIAKKIVIELAPFVLEMAQQQE